MPTVVRHKGFRLLFFSNEDSPREPVHVHVRRGDALVKFWLDPSVRLADSHGFTPGELREIDSVMRENEAAIRRAWNDYFGD
ncbi:MAG: DUF4160 domain-containing protein [Chloroflexi bacterium]|nr:DUF4160 domain-containing protein [Chloroflexota bacterium]